MPLVRILEVELYPTLLSKARSFGLSNDWVQVHFLPDTTYFQFSFLFLLWECLLLLALVFGIGFNVVQEFCMSVKSFYCFFRFHVFFKAWLMFVFLLTSLDMCFEFQ